LGKEKGEKDRKRKIIDAIHLPKRGRGLVKKDLPALESFNCKSARNRRLGGFHGKRKILGLTVEEK